MYNGVGIDESTVRKILTEYTEAKRREAEANAAFVSTMTVKVKDWEPSFKRAAAAAVPEAPKKIERLVVRQNGPKPNLTLLLDRQD